MVNEIILSKSASKVQIQGISIHETWKKNFFIYNSSQNKPQGLYGLKK